MTENTNPSVPTAEAPAADKLPPKEVFHLIMDQMYRALNRHAYRRRQQWIFDLAEECALRAYVLALKHVAEGSLNVPAITRYLEDIQRRRDREVLKKETA